MYLSFILNINTIFLVGLIVFLIALIIFGLFKILEFNYVRLFKKPLIVHFYLFKRSLEPEQQAFLLREFSFYKQLKPYYKKAFEHRVIQFINDKEFIGREGFIVDEEVKLLIASTAVMLTFGFKHYLIHSIDKIIIYPKTFYSKINKEYHKGEFNPQLKTIVFSWEDFLEGYEISNDNLNLGIHEFAHALHINNMRNSSESAIVFGNGFLALINYLSTNEDLRSQLMQTNYIREYAFTNQFEFLAVLIETFIETPKEFKAQFPVLYKKVKTMLNFNFAGY